MIRVVFDTSVLYSAILKPKGVPAAVFDFVGSGLLIPCVSPAVLVEYRDVLLDRPALRPYAQQAQHVLDILTSVAVEVTPIQPLKISGHESDNRFYECADAARADYIVTGNLKHFSQSHKNTRIVNPRQFLELLAGTHGERRAVMDRFSEVAPWQPLLVAEISADYPKKPGVLDRWSFTIRHAEILGLIGQSGSGQSTITLAVPRLLELRGCSVRGTIHFCGRDLMTCNASALRRIRGREIGLVPQSPMSARNPALRVETHLRDAADRKSFQKVSEGNRLY